MPRRPSTARRPRLKDWPRVDRITVGVNIIERFALRSYAARNHLAVGAAARELIAVALLLDAEANPSASSFNAAVARVREQEAAGSAEVAKINAALGITSEATSK